MKKESICFVNPTVLVRRPISELAREFVKRGWDVAILTPSRRGETIDKSLHHANFEGVKILTFPTVTLPFIDFEWPIPVNFALWRHLKFIKQNYRVVQIWTFFYLTILFPLLSLWRSKQKVILTMDTLPAYSYPLKGLFGLIFRVYTKTLGKLLFKIPSCISVYSSRLKDMLLGFGVKKNIYVITTGIQPSVKSDRSVYVRKELNLDSSDFVVTFVGLVTPRKGVDLVIDIAQRCTDMKFVVVGDGPNRDSYIADCEKRSINNVFFLGRRRDVFEIYAESDVFLLPSRGEGLAGVVFEAMESGIPVIASNIPCIDEQIEDGKQGLLCGYENVDEFCEALKRLKNDPNLRKKMGASGKSRIKRFYWDNLMDDYLELYK